MSAGFTGLLALGICGILLVLDVTQGFLTSGAHAVLSAVPLVLVALAYLAHEARRRLSTLEIIKALVLAAAFLLWSAYQLFPHLPEGAILNDLAIGLFVLDVTLVLADRTREAGSLVMAEGVDVPVACEMGGFDEAEREHHAQLRLQLGLADPVEP